MTFTLDNIDRVAAVPLAAGQGWLVTFASTNEGLAHQLYADGRLADSAAPGERQFILSESCAGRQLVVAAVDSESADADLSSQLPPQLAQPPWVFAARFLRLPAYGRGAVARLFGDGTGGAIDFTHPLATVVIWPPDEDIPQLPGFGQAAFGCGTFGWEAPVIVLSASPEPEGLHHLVVEVRTADGAVSRGAPIAFHSYPPPPAPAALRTAGYDPMTSTLSLYIE